MVSQNKYLISVDIEGITGVANRLFSDTDGRLYEQARRQMESDVNAVVEGILSIDKNAYILVRDAHNSAVNLNIERLNPAVYLYQGWGDRINMLEGLAASFRGVFLVGYHAGATNNRALLAHTLSSSIHFLKVNSQIINETGVAALYAAHYKVPIALVSGDNHAINEAQQQLNGVGDIVYAQVKESHARDSAISLSLSAAQKLLRDSAALATRNLQQNLIKPWSVILPLTMEIALHNIGYQPSLYQRLRGTLDFDRNYIFDDHLYSIKFHSTDILEAFAKLNLLAQLIFVLKAK